MTQCRIAVGLGIGYNVTVCNYIRFVLMAEFVEELADSDDCTWSTAVYVEIVCWGIWNVWVCEDCICECIRVGRFNDMDLQEAHTGSYHNHSLRASLVS